MIENYYSELNKLDYKKLSKEEEKEIFIKIKNGDVSARKKIIINNLRLVVNCAMKFKNSGIDMSDIISEGNLGLITAIEKYNISKDVKFSTYSFFWINRYIYECLRRNSGNISLPLNKHKEIYHFKNYIKTLGNKPFTAEEASKELNINKNHIFDCLTFSEPEIRLDNQADDHLLISEDNYEIHELREELSILMKTLTNKEKKIIFLLYGLNNNEKHSAIEIANKMKLSRERIRQIRDQALLKLKTSFYKTNRTHKSFR